MTQSLAAAAAAGAMLPALNAMAAAAEPQSKKPVPALYRTRAEAEKAAPLFGCQGAHAMGNAWMPCTAHPAPANPQHGPH